MLILDTWPRKSISNKVKTVFHNIFPIMIIKGKETTKKMNINLFKVTRGRKKKNHITMFLKLISPQRHMCEELGAGATY